MLLERKALATASDVARFKPQISDWVEVLLDEFSTASSRWDEEEANEKRLKNMVSSITNAVALALQDETSGMAYSSKKNIREERCRLTEQGMTPGSRALGAFAPTDQVDRIKTGLSRLHDGMVNDIIAEEGLMTGEAEDMAAEGIIELVREFLDSIGYRHMIDEY